MPFQSEQQRRFMHARHPEIAKRWEAEEKSGNYRRRSNRRGKKVATDNSFAAAVDRRRFMNRRKARPGGVTPMPSGRAIKTLPATRAPGSPVPRPSASTLPSRGQSALQATLNRRLNRIRSRSAGTMLPPRRTT